MYRLVTIRDTVRVPPDQFDKEVNQAVLDILREDYEGTADKDLGVIVSAISIKKIGIGRILMGDGASYHDVVFDALVYTPVVNEVVRGEVLEIVEFGAFVRLGPLDGLIHVSQVMDDFVSYDRKKGALYGKESKRTLKEGDRVRARIVTVSMKKGEKASKIGLTMRQPGLGKIEWIEKAQEEAEKGQKGEKS
jgi:DNA-directed RNA polymerase subunit E'